MWRALRTILLVAVLSVGPLIALLVGLGAARPRLFQSIGHELHALRFDGPRIQYWHGQFFAVEGVVAGGRYYCVQVQPEWEAQYARTLPPMRHPTGSFNPFDDRSAMGFSRHPWWPPIGAPITASTYGPQSFPGRDGAPVLLRSGPAVTVRTAMSWFVLAIAWLPWALAAAVAVARLARRRRRGRTGLCRGCGYDLRASPTLCPECGLRPPPST